jgi:hypothetical protein
VRRLRYLQRRIRISCCPDGFVRPAQVLLLLLSFLVMCLVFLDRRGLLLLQGEPTRVLAEQDRRSTDSDIPTLEIGVSEGVGVGDCFKFCKEGPARDCAKRP